MLQHSVVAGKASDVVLAAHSTVSRVKVRHQTSTRLPILRGMSGEGERVNLPIAGGLAGWRAGDCFERNKEANRAWSGEVGEV